jgi:UDP-N-acetyl-D-galactosamine dehydrogenase
LISIIGLGYVGLPLAVAFAEKGKKIIGFDLNCNKIDSYKKGIDLTKEVGNLRLSSIKNLKFTCEERELEKTNIFIIAVPTPIKADKTPDLEPIKKATKMVSKYLKKNDTVIYESTVYPGTTEEICVPILENHSGLKYIYDFKVGYSPERINPGDKKHRLENITKVVSGCDDESTKNISNLYNEIIKAGIYEAPSIKVAEAAKVIENTQRDLNIAFINELSLIFDKLQIDTNEVLKAAGTKWNFLNFKPGLVGGHCIGVDPYYLTYKANLIGYKPKIILAGRELNDGMAKIVARKMIKNLIKNNIKIKNSRVLIMGLTFKEDCPDLRNSKVIDIIEELKDYGVDVYVTDPIANYNESKKEYGIELVPINEVKDIDGLIIAVGHSSYKSLDPKDIQKLFLNNLNKYTIVDIKSILEQKKFDTKFDIWRL